MRRAGHHYSSMKQFRLPILRGLHWFGSTGPTMRCCDNIGPTTCPAILLWRIGRHNVKSAVRFPARHHASDSRARLQRKPYCLPVLIPHHEMARWNDCFFKTPWFPGSGLQVIGMNPASVRIAISFAAFSPDDPVDFLAATNGRQRVAGFAEDNLFAINFYTVAHYDLRAH